MNIQNIFSVPLGWTLLDNVDNDNLFNYCKGQLKPNGQSYKLDVNKDPLKNLSKIITAEVNKFHITCGLKFSQKILDAWFNYGSPEIICKPHVHPEAFFVAIYYLNDSDVELNFLNPFNSIENLIPPDIINSYNEYNRIYATIPPKKGLLIIHPAWIAHYVSNIQDNRMSIAFNMVLDKSKKNI